jgi:hypothetical protein
MFGAHHLTDEKSSDDNFKNYYCCLPRAVHDLLEARKRAKKVRRPFFNLSTVAGGEAP